MKYEQYREKICKMALRLVNAGLIRLSSGNISIRVAENEIAITPSLILYEQMVLEDIIIMDLDGQIIDGKNKPSVEHKLHIESMKARSDINAVIHTHSINTMALSLLGHEIPIINSELVALGGPVPILRYLMPGTYELASSIADTFHAKPTLQAVILENHGAVVVGSDLNHAFKNAIEVETGSEVYLKALQTGLDIRELSISEYKNVYEKYFKKK